MLRLAALLALTLAVASAPTGPLAVYPPGAPTPGRFIQPNQ